VFRRDYGRSVYSVVKNKAVNSRNFSIFEVPENLIGLGLLSKLVSGLTASQTAKEHSYRAILRSLDFGRAVLFSMLEINGCPWKVKKSSPSSGKNNKKRGKWIDRNSRHWSRARGAECSCALCWIRNRSRASGKLSKGRKHHSEVPKRQARYGWAWRVTAP